ncbi:MAG: tRNA (adenosine(37)-N6)-threonylcarbamoyltransferase complex ATPase subunit type 1 TsaE [Pseudomonadota bacterium]
MEFLGDDTDCTFKTFGPEETERLGKALGTQLIPGDVVALIGELGTGKTCFTRGIATGLGVEQNVPIVSPSFTILNEYPGPIPLYHFDMYRIDTTVQFFDLGYQEYFFGNGATVIEWGEKVGRFLPEEHIRVSFFFLEDTIRKITIRVPARRFGSFYKVLVKSCT